jgi:hypothetical protein
VKYVEDLVLLAKEETVLQGRIDRLTEIGRRSGMKINAPPPSTKKKRKRVMTISRQPSPVQPSQ